MATLAQQPLAPAGAEERFFLRAAIAMAVTIFAGFSFHLAMGLSTFASPILVHAHAVTFMGWVVLYLLQNFFVASNRMPLHRTLGWIGAFWVVAMIGLGTAVTVAMVRRGAAPFFFRPQQFLVFDPLAVLTFAGLTFAAIALRRRTDWHRRLHYCGMALLTGPGIGRLLPMPLLKPWAFEWMFLVLLIFPVVGIWSDVRRNGRVHPAWRWGVAAMIGSALLTEVITFSPAGDALYRAATAGSPGSAVPGLGFPPPPGAAVATPTK